MFMCFVKRSSAINLDLFCKQSFLVLIIPRLRVLVHPLPVKPMENIAKELARIAGLVRCVFFFCEKR